MRAIRPLVFNIEEVMKVFNISLCNIRKYQKHLRTKIGILGSVVAVKLIKTFSEETTRVQCTVKST